MGFFHFSTKAAKRTAASSVGGTSVELLHRLECSICPLNKAHGRNAKMKPTGSDEPVIYMLGDWPREPDLLKNKHQSTRAGSLIRSRIPDEWKNRLRWNSVIRDKPLKANPGRVEIECCRPSVERDIAETKPIAIFGFGDIPLQWAVKTSQSIVLWRGRKVPVNIGGHKCWFFPMGDPYFVLNKRKFEPRDLNTFPSDIEFAFAFDLQRSFYEIENGLPEPVIHDRDEIMAGVEVVDDPDRAIELIRRTAGFKAAGLDYETNGLRPYIDDARILTAALSTGDISFAFPIHHSRSTWSSRDRERVLDVFEEFLYDAQTRKIAHHLAFEMEWSAMTFGRDVLYSGQWGDTESQAFVIDQRPGSKHLADLTTLYFGFDLKEITGDIDTKKLDHLPVDEVCEYNALDAKYHRAVYFKQSKVIKELDLVEVYEEHMRRPPALVSIQMRGMPIDEKQAKKLDDRYAGQLEEIEKEINSFPEIKRFYREKQKKFLPGAHFDVLYVFAKILGHKITSTKEEILKEIDHPIAKLILEWRSVNKSRSTYVMMPGAEGSLVYPDGKLHPTFGSNRVRTSRTNSGEPNAQNWPKHVDEANEIRRQVASGKVGYKIVSFDYSGIQARNVGMESKDKTLVEAYWHNYDIHADWRDRILRIYPKWGPGHKAIMADKDLMKAYRQRAKNQMVFPSFFGAQPKKLAEGLEIPVECCEEVHEEFWDRFPRIKKWHKKLNKQYYEFGYVSGLSGYRRYAPVAQTELINSPIQADETIIVCDAISRLTQMDQELLTPILEVHDDLTFLWPEKLVDELSPIVISTMLDIPYEWAHIVPMGVEMSIGSNWGDMEEIGKYDSMTWLDGKFNYGAKK